MKSAYPIDVTFHDLMRQNRRNSVLLMIAMGALTCGVITIIGLAVMVYGEGAVSPFGIVIAVAAGLAVTIIASSWSYYSGGSTLLSISGANEIQKADDPELFNVVEELSIAAGLPMPRVYLMESPALNAFATGRDAKHAAVAITRGLRDKLPRDQVQAVMAHEMAHVRHLDIRLTMLVATMVGLIVLACDVLLRASFYGGAGRRRRSSGDKGNGAAALLMVLAIILAIVAPLLAKLIQFAVSRQREYLADAGAVELTRNPQAMADALRSLTADHTPLETASRATAHMFIINPLMNAKHQENLNSVFSTHPPISERIARLEALLR